MWVFQGHQVAALLIDLALPLVIFIVISCFLRIFLYNRSIWGKASLILVLYLIVFWWPNSVYAMLEIKHLLVIDTVADNPDLASFLVFGGISLFGYLLTVFGNHWIIQNLGRKKMLTNLFLSLTGGFGGVAGLANLNSIQTILSPDILISFSVWLLHQPHLILLSLILATILFLSNSFLLKPS